MACRGEGVVLQGGEHEQILTVAKGQEAGMG